MHTTGYDRDMLRDDTQWEFKIVRARNREFGQREHLETLLREESLAGWIMTDKYNDSQVRFRRRRAARSQDRFLPPHIDPYRTIYIPAASLSAQNLHLIALAIVLAVVLVAIALVVVLVSLPT